MKEIIITIVWCLTLAVAFFGGVGWGTNFTFAQAKEHGYAVRIGGRYYWGDSSIVERNKREAGKNEEAE